MIQTHRFPWTGSLEEIISGCGLFFYIQDPGGPGPGEEGAWHPARVPIAQTVVVVQPAKTYSISGQRPRRQLFPRADRCWPQADADTWRTAAHLMHHPSFACTQTFNELKKSHNF